MLQRFLQPSSAIVGFFVPTSAPRFSYYLRSRHFASHFLRLSSSTSGANVQQQQEQQQQQQRQEEHGHGVSSKLVWFISPCALYYKVKNLPLFPSSSILHEIVKNVVGVSNLGLLWENLIFYVPKVLEFVEVLKLMLQRDLQIK